MKKLNGKKKKEPKHEARFSFQIDCFKTFEKLESAGLLPLQDGGRPTKDNLTPGAQIRVELNELQALALISETKLQIFYKNNEDLSRIIWELQPFVIDAETQKPADNLATRLEYTTLITKEIEDIRKKLLVNDLEMLIQLEKNRILKEIFLSLVSELKSIDDIVVQAKIKPIVKKATDLFLTSL